MTPFEDDVLGSKRGGSKDQFGWDNPEELAYQSCARTRKSGDASIN
jgi:hypothetical protein